MARGDLSDEEWAVIGELLPSERGRKARPSHDNRRFLDGMLFVLRAGCPWRDMHERYGKWHSILKEGPTFSRRSRMGQEPNSLGWRGSTRHFR